MDFQLYSCNHFVSNIRLFTVVHSSYHRSECRNPLLTKFPTKCGSSESQNVNNATVSEVDKLPVNSNIYKRWYLFRNQSVCDALVFLSHCKWFAINISTIEMQEFVAIWRTTRKMECKIEFLPHEIGIFAPLYPWNGVCVLCTVCNICNELSTFSQFIINTKIRSISSNWNGNLYTTYYILFICNRTVCSLRNSL